jgi:hypothetical protein
MHCQQHLAAHMLALVGIPSGGDLASTAVQTNGPVEPAPLLVPVQPVPALMPAPIIIRAAYDPIPNGVLHGETVFACNESTNGTKLNGIRMARGEAVALGCSCAFFVGHLI